MIKKRIRTSLIATSVIVPVLVAALFGISIWANKPRGITINLD